MWFSASSLRSDEVVWGAWEAHGESHGVVACRRDEGPSPERREPSTRARVGTSSVPPRRRDSGEAVALRDDAQKGSRDSYFLFLGFRVNDCGKRLWVLK